MTVDIEYCVPCGHLDRAIATQRAILERFGEQVDGVRLTTGHGGVFTIRVDGDRSMTGPRRSTSTGSSPPSTPPCDATRAAAVVPVGGGASWP